MHATRTAVLLAADHDLDVLSEMEHELRKRYDADYRVVCESSAEVVIARLEELKTAGEELALVLAEQCLPGTTGFLEYVCRIYSTAKRALLIVRRPRRLVVPCSNQF